MTEYEPPNVDDRLARGGGKPPPRVDSTQPASTRRLVGARSKVLQRALAELDRLEALTEALAERLRAGCRLASEVDALMAGLELTQAEKGLRRRVSSWAAAAEAPPPPPDDASDE